MKLVYYKMIQNTTIFKLIFVMLLFDISTKNVACEKRLSDLFKMTTTDMIKEEGYQAEEHNVITDDGYLLTVHRIPGSLGAPTIFLQHGLICNSFDWVVMGKNKSLGFILADHGYDVWLGNARGNTYSRRHVSLDPSSQQFWDFSFHEMGIYDLPAVITYITTTKNDSIFYVGHSMGTTMSYIMAIERPDIAAKIKVIFSFAPAVFMSHATTPAILSIKNPYAFEDFTKKIQFHEFVPQSPFLRIMLKYYCYNYSKDNICAQILNYAVGYTPSQFNHTLWLRIISHTPAGSSVKAFIHYLQLAKSGKFQQYDYRSVGNKIKYNTTKPPEYDMSRIKVPIALFWSDNDMFVHPKDVQILYDAIPKKVLSYRIPYSQFSHIDFMYAMNAPSVLYAKFLSVLKDYC